MKRDPGNNPAARVVAKFDGSVAKVAAFLGKDRATINRWFQPRISGGTEGLVPANHQKVLVEAGACTPAELVWQPGDTAPGEVAA